MHLLPFLLPIRRNELICNNTEHPLFKNQWRADGQFITLLINITCAYSKY